MIIIPGYTPDDKVPGVVAINQWGAGRASVGATTLVCVLFGNAGSGTGVVNERYPIGTEEEADTRYNPRSELARMLHAALDVEGATLLAVPVAVPGGAVQARTSFTVGGTWGTGGEIRFQYDEVIFRVQISPTMTVTTAGDAIEDAINQAQNGRLFCTAVNTAGTVVSTVFTPGVRGNQHTMYVDMSDAPAGMTLTFNQHSTVTQSGAGPAIAVSGQATLGGAYVLTITTGGANGTAQFSLTRDGTTVDTGEIVPTTPFTYAIAGEASMLLTFANDTYILNETYSWTTQAPLANGGQPFFLGSGTDDIQAALAATASVTNDYIGLAQNDATNVGYVEVSCNGKAAFDVGRLEQYVTIQGRGMAAAQALGQTGMNDQLGTCGWAQNHPEHPSRLAARLAALFSVTDGAQPNTNYDDVVVPGAAPHYAMSDVPNRTTLKTALNNSLTPLVTVDGKLVITRAICSRSLNGTTPDYRTYDHADVAVAIRVRKECVALGQDAKAANPYSGPDIPGDLPPEGTMSPSRWQSIVYAAMKDWEGPNFNWLEQVDAFPPTAWWDSGPRRIMSLVKPIAKTQFHQLGIIVRQQAA